MCTYCLCTYFVPIIQLYLLSDEFDHKPVVVQLVQKAEIDYLCPICTEPLTEPYLSIECGHHLCRQCRDHLLGTGKTECPTCREPNVLTNAVPNKHLQRIVESFKVFCLDYKEGCKWVGELRDLHDHVDRQCGIACPFGCSKYVRRSKMRDHLHHHCHKRMISCNCGYYNTFTIVTEKHYPICPHGQSPIDCPNQHCQREGLRRHRLEQHLNVDCAHQLVDCPNIGCSVRLPRGKMKLHTLKQHNQLLQETKQAVAITPATVSPQYLYNQAPMEFIISDFLKKKEANAKWIISQFYTHKGGYNFCLEVYPNGYGTGIGSHLSVVATLLRGNYDAKLDWPFEGDIRVELLNWKVDKSHHSNTILFNRYNDPDGTSTSRVTEQKTATGLIRAQFISHTALVPTENTEYLLDGYFKLRISVAHYPAPLLTPAWQDDSPVTAQSVAEFTVIRQFFVQ